jgi:hypothetical protein
LPFRSFSNHFAHRLFCGVVSGESPTISIDKNSVLVGLNIRKKDLYVKAKEPQAKESQRYEEGSRQILQLTITKILHHDPNLPANAFKK